MLAASFVVILLVEGDSSRTLDLEVFLVKLSDLGPKRAFFRSEGSAFVADLASDKMFRMVGDNIGEISGLDIKLILLTLLQLVSRERALRGVSNLVGRLSSDEELARVCLREEPLRAVAPPGAAHVVESREHRVAEL